MKNLFTGAAALAAAMMLAGCGGGGDAAPPGSPSIPSTPITTTGPTASASCPNGASSGVWIDQRLGCLTVGAQVVNGSASYASPSPSYPDQALVLKQDVEDTSFNAVGKSRYYSHFLCIRHAAPLQGGTGYPISVGTDMLAGLKLAPWDAMPPGILASTIGVVGGNQAGWVQMACDPAVHPVIVDYATGKIESVNPGALAKVSQYSS